MLRKQQRSEIHYFSKNSIYAMVAKASRLESQNPIRATVATASRLGTKHISIMLRKRQRSDSLKIRYMRR